MSLARSIRICAGNVYRVKDFGLGGEVEKDFALALTTVEEGAKA
jgi:hypothetical protein